KLPVILYHDPVTRDLCDNGCGGNGKTAGVTLLQGFLRKWHRYERDTVHKEEIGHHGKRFYCLTHGGEGGLKNVDRIDRFAVTDTDGNSQGTLLDQGIQLFTPE